MKWVLSDRKEKEVLCTRDQHNVQWSQHKNSLPAICSILFCFIILFYSSGYVTEENFEKFRRQQRDGFAVAHSEIHKCEWLPEET